MNQSMVPRKSPMPPGPRSVGQDHVRNIALDLIITILTCGLYNLWVQHKQMVAVNDMLQESKYHFLPWFLLSLVTCGLYHVYHEYRVSQDIDYALGVAGNSREPLINLILSIIGLHIVADAIQQSHINRYYGSTQL